MERTENEFYYNVEYFYDKTFNILPSNSLLNNIMDYFNSTTIILKPSSDEINFKLEITF